VKLQQLRITNFGKFADRELTFDSGRLCVVYGENEAGKTTLLQFLRDLLFDFRNPSTYDFKTGAPLSGVGTLQLSDGRNVELRRQKGIKHKGTLKIDGVETDLDASNFSRLIGHADRNLFESIFAFGLDQLAKGEESLKDESLQASLFGGGLGGSISPQKIQDELEKLAESLFKPSASKPPINNLVKELGELGRDIRKFSLKPSEFLNKERQVATLRETAEKARDVAGTLQREKLRLERLLQAADLWTALLRKQAERAPLVVPPSLHPEARGRYQSALEKLAETEGTFQRLTNQQAELEENLRTTTIDESALACRVEINACRELKKSYVDARRDLPGVIHECNDIRRQIDAELADLRPGWNHADLDSFSADIATREQLDKLIEQQRDESSRRSTLSVQQEGLARQLDEATTDLALLGPETDVSTLTAVLADEPEYLSDLKEQRRKGEELSKTERRLLRQIRKLGLPETTDIEGSLEEAVTLVEALRPPRPETLDQYDHEDEALRKQRQKIEDDRRSLEDEQAQLQSQWDETESNSDVPGLEQLANAREHREAGWQLIRLRYIEQAPAVAEEEQWRASTPNSTGEVDNSKGIATQSAGPLELLYEQAVHAADDIADRIYRNADRVAKRETLRRRMEETARKIEAKREDLARVENQERELRQRWLAEWKGCASLEADSPRVMRGWCGDLQTVSETLGEWRDLGQSLRELEARISAFESRLRAASQTHTAAPEQEIDVVRAQLRSQVDEAKAVARQRKELSKNIPKREKELKKLAGELAALEASAIQRCETLKPLLARLGLPIDWNAEFARTVIERLNATRVRLADLPSKERRVEQMTQRIAEFEAQVHSLCERVAPELAKLPADVAEQQLTDRAGAAADDLSQCEAWRKRLAEIAVELKDLVQQRTRSEEERRSLLESAEAADEIQFLEVVGRRDSIVRLDRDIEQLSRELDAIRGGEDREQFSQALRDIARDELAAKLETCLRDLEKAERERSEAEQGVGAAERELAQLDGTSEAARLAEDVALKRSQLAGEVDRYVPLVFARHLLAEAVKRHDRANRPEMMAAVSRLISRMTGGRYVGFDRTGEDRKQILLVNDKGSELMSTQLSTGTREQLYLAIRLAYVEQYCRQNEPLPIVMDDVLVNFDAGRARNTLAALAEMAQRQQVLYFTCHRHMVEMAREICPGLEPVTL